MWKTPRLLSITALLALGAASSFSGVAHAAGGAAGGPTSAALTGGSLTIAGGAPGTFTANLTGANQTVDTSLAAYTVTDATGTGAGWNVTAQATQFTCVVSGDPGCKTGFTTLPLSSLTIAPPAAACASGSTCTGSPTVSISAVTAIDGAAAVKVLDAPLNTGAGSFTVTPGTMGTGQLALAIPGNALATIYHSTLTITVISGP